MHLHSEVGEKGENREKQANDARDASNSIPYDSVSCEKAPRSPAHILIGSLTGIQPWHAVRQVLPCLEAPTVCPAHPKRKLIKGEKKIITNRRLMTPCLLVKPHTTAGAAH